MGEEVVPRITAWLTGKWSGETARDGEDRQPFEESSDPHCTFAEFVVLQSVGRCSFAIKWPDFPLYFPNCLLACPYLCYFTSGNLRFLFCKVGVTLTCRQLVRGESDSLYRFLDSKPILPPRADSCYHSVFRCIPSPRTQQRGWKKDFTIQRIKENRARAMPTLDSFTQSICWE